MISMQEQRLEVVISSALWAAYGDALGFITELTTIGGLKTRTNQSRITSTLPWQRTVGGKFGAKVELPAGAYSDDTQLRLATSRAIRGNGDFDVEAFAKIELPVWLAYALGAGRGSKAAAASLSKASVNWFSNFYDQSDIQYISGGGNGAAMRIQPHVWAAKNTCKIKSYLPDVIRNSICTHGHVRGIGGAVFHAIALADTISKDKILEVREWVEIANYIPNITEIVHADPDLATFWLPTWESRSNSTFFDALIEVRDEIIKDIEITSTYLNKNLSNEEKYRDIVDALGASSKEQRGSGTKTALLASILSYLYKQESPEHALIACVNLLSNDTDTIGTMAGALLGVVNLSPPNGLLQDQSYIVEEATRLHAISCGRSSTSFNYPDLLRWQAPKTSIDALGIDSKNAVVLSGLGKGELSGLEYLGQGKGANIWQWLKLDIGQTVLCKRRRILRRLNESNFFQTDKKINIQPQEIGPMAMNQLAGQTTIFRAQSDLLEDLEKSDAPRTLDELTADAIRSGFDPNLIGSHILGFSNSDNGIELAIAYASIIIKARIARARSRKFS